MGPQPPLGSRRLPNLTESWYGCEVPLLKAAPEAVHAPEPKKSRGVKERLPASSAACRVARLSE